MQIRSGGRRRRDEGGASAVEFALVVPILLLVLFGIVNFGVVFAQQLSLSNGARQAARFAVVNGPTCQDVINEGMNNAATIGMTASEVPTPVVSGCGGGSAVKPCEGTAIGTNITVTMTRPAQWIVNIAPFNLIPAPTLTGKGIMRCEFR